MWSSVTKSRGVRFHVLRPTGMRGKPVPESDAQRSRQKSSRGEEATCSYMSNVANTCVVIHMTNTLEMADRAIQTQAAGHYLTSEATLKKAEHVRRYLTSAATLKKACHSCHYLTSEATSKKIHQACHYLTSEATFKKADHAFTI